MQHIGGQVQQECGGGLPSVEERPEETDAKLVAARYNEAVSGVKELGTGQCSTVCRPLRPLSYQDPGLLASCRSKEGKALSQIHTADQHMTDAVFADGGELSAAAALEMLQALYKKERSYLVLDAGHLGRQLRACNSLNSSRCEKLTNAMCTVRRAWRRHLRGKGQEGRSRHETRGLPCCLSPVTCFP